MKIFPLLLLLTLGACHSTPAPDYSLKVTYCDKVATASDGGLITPAQKEAILSAVCKVGIPFVGSGSGVAIARDKEEQTDKDGKKFRYTYILTAKHVADDSKLFTVEYRKDQLTYNEIGERVWLSDRLDLALIRVKDSKINLLPLDLKFEVKIPESGDSKKYHPTCYVVGCAGGMFPPAVTIGFVNFLEKWYIGVDAAAYYGNSGGAIIDTQTGKAIGVLTQGGFDYPTGFVSDRVCGMNLSAIDRFINEEIPEQAKKKAEEEKKSVK
ncbi:MAG TPA: serine protease [Nitrosopumilaceae archaeon]|nr:serine protease [Nitrosopumilaceae archaeon]